MSENGHISEPLRCYAVDIQTLRRDPRNARLHPERNLHAIRLSLRKFGQQKPIVLADDGLTVIAGNGTLDAALLEGWTRIAAVTSSLAGRDAAAFGLADNRTAETAEWDFERVNELIAELGAFRYDVESLGWGAGAREALQAAEHYTAPEPADHLNKPPAPVTSERRQPAAAERCAPPAGGRPELQYVPFTDDQHTIVQMAVGKLREIENDPAISEGRALELIAADWLAAN